MKMSIHHSQRLRKQWFRVTTQPGALWASGFSSPNAHTYNPESLLKCRLWPRSSGWGQRFCIFNKAPDDAEADDPWTKLWEWLRMISTHPPFDGLHRWMPHLWASFNSCGSDWAGRTHNRIGGTTRIPLAQSCSLAKAGLEGGRSVGSRWEQKAGLAFKEIEHFIPVTPGCDTWRTTVQS